MGMMGQRRSSLAFVSVVLGFLLTVQVRTTLLQKESLHFLRHEELAARLIETEKERDELRLELQKLTKEVEEHNAIEAKATSVRMAAGSVPLTGPGITVTMEDSKGPMKAGENQNLYIIHDEDILKVINELRAAGAEAVSINGQRLVATSEIRCAGPTLSVNNVRSAPPFEIIALGDARALDNSLKMRGGVVDNLKVWGINLKIQRAEKLTVPAYNGPSPFKYAAPVDEDTADVKQGGSAQGGGRA